MSSNVTNQPALTTVFAEQGASGSTMLYRDLGRTRWLAVHYRALGEGEVVNDCNSRPALLVTWAREVAQQVAA